MYFQLELTGSPGFLPPLHERRDWSKGLHWQRSRFQYSEGELSYENQWTEHDNRHHGKTYGARQPTSTNVTWSDPPSWRAIYRNVNLAHKIKKYDKNVFLCISLQNKKDLIHAILTCSHSGSRWPRVRLGAHYSQRNSCYTGTRNQTVI